MVSVSDICDNICGSVAGISVGFVSYSDMVNVSDANARRFHICEQDDTRPTYFQKLGFSAQWGFQYETAERLPQS
jgi:hypothetical protein